LAQQQAPNPLEDDDDQLPASKPEHAKQLTIRVGIGILTFGLIVTIFGASRLAGGAPTYGSYAGVIHQIGLVVMFAGTIVLLIGYRIPWFAKLLEERSQREQLVRPTSGAIGHAEHQAMSVPSQARPPAEESATGSPEPWIANFVILACLVGSVLLLSVLILALPNRYAAWPVVLFTALAFLACLVCLIYGTSYQRTFCIGAMLTLGLLFAQWWLFLLRSFAGGTYGGRMYSYSLMEVFRVTTQNLVSAAGQLRLYTVIMWTAALVLGATAVGLRLALEATNRLATRR
jgi:hypothetical protein